jgi:hypothetical protein
MSNGSAALPLALGASGGLLLWYFLYGGKHAPAPASAASNANQAAATPPAAPAPPAPPVVCMLRLDREGLTADGVRVGISEAVKRCMRASRTDLTVTADASATVYTDLMAALGFAGILPQTHQAAGGPRNARAAAARAVADVDLPTFASTIRSLAEQIEPDPTPAGLARGRFGERKVFIAALRRALRGTDYARLSRAAIDELLLRAHREQLLVLARADLVAVMDSSEVRDSEIKHPAGAEFHFVVNERGGGGQ